MKTLIDYNNAGTMVKNTKMLIANAIAAHNADENAHSDTAITSGLIVAVGDTEPTGDYDMWLDTSSYASIQGSIDTFFVKQATDHSNSLVVGSTEPADYTLWLNTSGYE